MRKFGDLTRTEWRALTCLGRTWRTYTVGQILSQDVSRDDLATLEAWRLAEVLVGGSAVRVVDIRDNAVLRGASVRLTAAGWNLVRSTLEIQVLLKLAISGTPWPVRLLKQRTGVDDATLLAMWGQKLIYIADRPEIEATSMRRLPPDMRLAVSPKGRMYVPETSADQGI